MPCIDARIATFLYCSYLHLILIHGLQPMYAPFIFPCAYLHLVFAHGLQLRNAQEKSVCIKQNAHMDYYIWGLPYRERRLYRH